MPKILIYPELTKRGKIRVVQESIPIAINGRHYFVERNVVVKVPAAVVEALKHATITTYHVTEKRRQLKKVERRRFPFYVIKAIYD